MLDLRTFAKFVTITLGNPAPVEVIEYTELPGRVTPRINIQNDKGKAKAYQVRQVLLAIDKLGE
jgi:hypothetical protein